MQNGSRWSIDQTVLSINVFPWKWVIDGGLFREIGRDINLYENGYVFILDIIWFNKKSFIIAISDDDHVYEYYASRYWIIVHDS